MKIDFQHKPAAHCENGVTSNMLRFYGIDLSEPMVLGLGSGLFFSHMPFIRLNGMAVTSFRPLPGQIFSRVCKKLNIKIKGKYFLNKDKAMKALDDQLLQGKPVGLRVGVYFLPYFPKEYRFHFNAHNICVIGKEDTIYTVSDPVSQTEETLSYDDLKRVRFAKGTWPPYGRMYWVERIGTQPDDLKPLLKKAILLNCKHMLDIPFSYFGVKGIHLMAKKMRSWEKKLSPKQAIMNLAQIIRMLEEIGTGGAGFRYMYAAFLYEASIILKQNELKDLSVEMSRIGDLWRAFAYEAARKFKKRSDDVLSYEQLAEKLDEIAGCEKQLFENLRTIAKKMMLKHG